MTAEVYIAGSRTAADWSAFRKTLAPGDGPHLWKNAFECYFHERLSLRYLEPIGTLQENGTFQGEGFSIVTIQCTLIEFLESTVQGISYRYRRRGDPPLGPHEYSDSGDLFNSFLTKRKPFSSGVTLEDEHGVVHMLAVSAVENAELLLAMRGIVGGVDI
jgi:hypothetical protein